MGPEAFHSQVKLSASLFSLLSRLHGGGGLDGGGSPYAGGLVVAECMSVGNDVGLDIRRPTIIFWGGDE